MNVQEIPIADIKIVENSRISIKNLEGLMTDINQRGLRSPIEVCKTKSNDYVIISGNRRLAACKKLGWKKIFASVHSDMEMDELLIHNLGENIHREDISPMELGRICDRLKKMGFNNSEIHAKLTIPLSRIVSALNVYYELPDKYRKRVSYVGGTNAKNGNISASVAAKISSVKKQYGLSEASIEKLMTIAKMDEMSTAQINLISIFLKEGLSVARSIEKIKLYKPTRTDIIVNIEEMDQLLDKYKMDSTIMLLQGIIYGEIPPLKKPDFVQLKQVPEKSNNKK